MTTMRKNTMNIDYAENLKKQLGIKDSDASALRKAFGLLKGKIKTSPVSYQRQLRKEWERKVRN